MASMWQELKYNLQIIKEILLPRHCAVCGAGINSGLVCERCRPNFILQKQWKFEPSEEYLAGASEAQPSDVLSSLHCLYKYDGAFKDALHKAKFDNDGSILPFLREEADLALPGAKLRWLGQFDIISYVPTSPERRRQRGYDVPDAIFGALLDERGTSIYCQDLLQRVRKTAPLFELKPDERRAEIKGCFVVNKKLRVQGKSILLIDDIYTTGATLTEAGLALLAAGAKSVHALTLTAARENWDR